MTEPDSFDTAPIRREAGLAVWRQVEHRLAEEIGSGQVDRNGRLPSEAELARRFGVNRHTLRRAISALAERGLVRVEQGRGMFVGDVVIDYPLKRRTSFSTNLLAQGKLPASDVVSVREMRAEGDIARALSLRSGAQVIRRQATGFADDVPINVGLTFFPSRRFPSLIAHLEDTPSISAALRASGIKDYRRLSTRILTRLPTAEEASALKQPATQPVLVTEAIDVDGQDQPISYGLTCFAGARVQITVEPDDGNGPRRSV